MRAIDQIKEEMTADFMRNDTAAKIYDFTPGDTFAVHFSRISVESILFYVFAVAAWVLESLFDQHKKEVDNVIANQKVTTTRWYANIAKEFLYGVSLPPDSDRYDTSKLNEEQIAKAKIITNSAVDDYGDRLRIKVAKDSNGKLAPLSAIELSAFKAYMQRVTPAGVARDITSTAADRLYLTLKVYVDPLVFSANGKVGEAEPVRDAVKAYLKKLPFNGMLVLAYLTDELQKIDGVVIPHVSSARAAYGSVSTPFDVKYQPDAGYLDFANDADLVITYELQSTIL